MKQSQIILNLSSNIKSIRTQNQLTQQNFADRLGIKRCLVGAWEEKRCIPNLEYLLKISELFKVEIKDLVTTIN